MQLQVHNQESAYDERMQEELVELVAQRMMVVGVVQVLNFEQLTGVEAGQRLRQNLVVAGDMQNVMALEVAGVQILMALGVVEVRVQIPMALGVVEVRVQILVALGVLEVLAQNFDYVVEVAVVQGLISYPKEVVEGAIWNFETVEEVVISELILES